MKALAEEKLYWQNEAFKARDLVEQQAAVIRAAKSDEAKHEEIYTRNFERDQAAQKLIKALAKAAGIELPAFNLPLATPVFINDLVGFVESEAAKNVADEMPEYFHVAWYGNGDLYMDRRALSREDDARSKAVFRQGGRIKLYARVPK